MAEQFTALHTSTNSRCTARPIANTRVLLDEAYVLETMRVDDERPKPRRPPHKVMPRIANNQSQIALASEIHTGLDLLLGRSQNDVFSVESARAWFRRVLGRQTGTVGVERPQVRDGMISPVLPVSKSLFLFSIARPLANRMLSSLSLSL